MGGVQVAAAAVDVEDPVPVPDGEVLIHPAGEEDRGGVAHDAEGVRAGTHAVRLRPAPDAGVTVRSGETVDQVEAPAVHCEGEVVRQAGQEPQDAAPLQGRPLVAQRPEGDHAAVLPPQLPGAQLAVGTQGAQAHLLVVAQQQGHVGGLHDPLQQVHAVRPPVDHVPDDIEPVPVGEADALQHPLKERPLPVEVRHAVDHGPRLLSRKVTASYHSLRHNATDGGDRAARAGGMAPEERRSEPARLRLHLHHPVSHADVGLDVLR